MILWRGLSGNFLEQYFAEIQAEQKMQVISPEQVQDAVRNFWHAFTSSPGTSSRSCIPRPRTVLPPTAGEASLPA